MTNTAKTLTFVIPAYNMESYLDRCVNSLLSASDTRDLEVLIVDDGSKDGTLEYARKLERTNPGVVRAIHQENKGHGGAVNTGIAAATGMYVKVVDADDWVDPQAIDTVLATLRAQREASEPIDMLVTNYVYDKVTKRHKIVVNFRHVMETGRVLGWDDLASSAWLSTSSCMCSLSARRWCAIPGCSCPSTRSTSISITRTSRSRG